MIIGSFFASGGVAPLPNRKRTKGKARSRRRSRRAAHRDCRTNWRPFTVGVMASILATLPRRREQLMPAPSSRAASSDLFTREDDSGVVTLTLNTPRSLNALSLAMLEALIAEFEAIATDDRARVIVLTGVGPALSAGHDLKEMQAHRNDCDRGRGYYVELFARCSTLMQAIVALPKPVIAAVEGIATAAGCQLVASCDLAI